MTAVQSSSRCPSKGFENKSLKEIDGGHRCIGTAKNCGVTKKTVSHWLKKKAEIFEAVEGNNV